MQQQPSRAWEDGALLHQLNAATQQVTQQLSSARPSTPRVNAPPQRAQAGRLVGQVRLGGGPRVKGGQEVVAVLCGTGAQQEMSLSCHRQRNGVGTESGRSGRALRLSGAHRFSRAAAAWALASTGQHLTGVCVQCSTVKHAHSVASSPSHVRTPGWLQPTDRNSRSPGSVARSCLHTEWCTARDMKHPAAKCGGLPQACIAARVLCNMEAAAQQAAQHLTHASLMPDT